MADLLHQLEMYSDDHPLIEKAAAELARLRAEVERLRAGLLHAREFVRRGPVCSWWNHSASCELMTKHINPALGLDAWDGSYVAPPRAALAPDGKGGE